jgi:large subunit ribosomal protein L11
MSYNFTTMPPRAPNIKKKAAGITAGSKVPNKDKVGKVTRKQILDIIKMKSKDMNYSTEEAAVRIISGTARSMGIEVVG